MKSETSTGVLVLRRVGLVFCLAAVIAVWSASFAVASAQSDSAYTRRQETEELKKRIQELQDQIDQLSVSKAPDSTRSDDDLRERIKKLEAAQNANPETPTSGKAGDDFPGSFWIPGSDARLRIGGFVKFSLVRNFDPIGSTDRFVTAYIPPGGAYADGAGDLSVTADQTRVYLDFREPLKASQLRAYIEADFAGSGNTLRLRHAYGQYNVILAGQTWSLFVDVRARPEEIDFEGLNGRIRVRQAQLRYFPHVMEALNLAVSLEDPSPDVTGGTGLSEVPDAVARIHRTVNFGHVQFSVLLRQIRARPGYDPTTTLSSFGWGMSFSGQIPAGWWGDQDNFQFQLNGGDGIGRYINDLGSAGGQDAVVDSTTAQLVTLKAAAGYVSFQHWWTQRTRSTLDYSIVYVDNLDIQTPASYHFTQRAMGNLLVSPTPRIDLGIELLWGERRNKDQSKGYATQLQFAAIYRF